jgi:hypothetical protein
MLYRKIVLIHFAVIIAFCLFCVESISAANWYVRPSGGGGTGASWADAWNNMNGINFSSVSCGDTIWVAGGTYTGVLALNKNCTSGSRLYIRRARSDANECTGAAGWSAGYDSNINHIGSGGSPAIRVSTGTTANYITVSGRTTASGGNNGWHINFSGTGGNAAFGMDFQNGASSITGNTFEYMDIQGPGNVNYPGGGRGVDLTPYQASCSGNTFSHMKIWDWESGAYACYCDGTTWEYITMYNIMAQNWSQFHPNGIYHCGGENNITVRYSNFHAEANGCGEGIFSNGGDGWKIYGNVFYNLTASGTKAIQLRSGTMTNFKVFNNTFDNVISPLYFSEGRCGSGAEARNNLFYNAGAFTCGSSSNNLTAGSTGVWVNRSSHNYQIVGTVGPNYPRNAGISLSAFFSKDVSGNAFGEDGAWDIGAYEFSAGTSTDHPTPPDNLRMVSP